MCLAGCVSLGFRDGGSEMEGDLDTREVQARSSKPQVQRLPVAMVCDSHWH